jgi:hypothetical protein
VLHIRSQLSAAAPRVRHRFLELPGAVFFGDAINDDESVDFAVRLQRICRKYKNDDCEEMLWHDLSQMGFDSSYIRQFVANPAAITNCGYGMPLPLR